MTVVYAPMAQVQCDVCGRTESKRERLTEWTEHPLALSNHACGPECALRLPQGRMLPRATNLVEVVVVYHYENGCPEEGGGKQSVFVGVSEQEADAFMKEATLREPWKRFSRETRIALTNGHHVVLVDAIPLGVQK